MRYTNENYETINELEINPEYGEIYQATIIKANAIAPDNIQKHAYYDDDYEDVIVFRRWSEQEYCTRKIAEYKQYLSKTDYIIIKIAEGVAVESEYDEIIEQRHIARKKINELENKLNAIHHDSP